MSELSRNGEDYLQQPAQVRHTPGCQGYSPGETYTWLPRLQHLSAHEMMECWEERGRVWELELVPLLVFIL